MKYVGIIGIGIRSDLDRFAISNPIPEKSGIIKGFCNLHDTGWYSCGDLTHPNIKRFMNKFYVKDGIYYAHLYIYNGGFIYV